jgi:hypothetical protein
LCTARLWQEGGVWWAVATGKTFAGVGGGEPPHSAECESLAHGIAECSSYEKRAHVRALPKGLATCKAVRRRVATGTLQT